MSEVFHCDSAKKESPFSYFKRFIAFVVFVTVSLLIIYNFQLIPALIPYAEAQTSTVITAEVQKIIRESINGQNNSFVNLKYGSDGNVVALETNTAAIAIVSASISENVIKKLSESDRIEISIPIGNLSGGALFTGRGPDISIPIAISPKITCEIENEFYESGINQTLHRVVAEIEVETYALIPVAPRKIDVETEYCIAETVIVGKVPDAYTKINRHNDDISESEIDDIYDFGATAD